MSDDSDLMKLYRNRVKDFKYAKSRRKRALEIGPGKMDQLLANYFKQSPQALNKIEEVRALAAWEIYVGRVASVHTRALRVRQNCLIVKVADALWMQQLHLLKNELLKKYRRDFPKLALNDIFFTRHDHAKQDPPATPEAPPPQEELPPGTSKPTR